MNILKHGNPNCTPRLMRFVCRECGCDWIAGPHEVYRNIGDLNNACYCPDCHELTVGKSCDEHSRAQDE